MKHLTFLSPCSPRLKLVIYAVLIFLGCIVTWYAANAVARKSDAASSEARVAILNRAEALSIAVDKFLMTARVPVETMEAQPETQSPPLWRDVEANADFIRLEPAGKLETLNNWTRAFDTYAAVTMTYGEDERRTRNEFVTTKTAEYSTLPKSNSSSLGFHPLAYMAKFFATIAADPEAAKRSEIFNRQAPLTSGSLCFKQTVAGPGKKITYTVQYLSQLPPVEVSRWNTGYDNFQRYIALQAMMRGYFNNRITVVWDFFNKDGRPLGTVTVAPDYASKVIAEQDRKSAIEAQEEFTRITEDLAEDAATQREEESKRAAEASERIAREVMFAEWSRESNESRREMNRQMQADMRARQEQLDRMFERQSQDRKEASERQEQQAREDRARKEVLAAAESARADADRHARELEAIQSQQLRQLQDQTDALQHLESIESQRQLDRLNRR